MIAGLVEADPVEFAKPWLSRAMSAYASTTPGSSARTCTSAGRRLPLNRMVTGSPVRGVEASSRISPIAANGYRHLVGTVASDGSTVPLTWLHTVRVRAPDAGFTPRDL